MPVFLAILQDDPTGLDFSGVISALTTALTPQQLIGYLAAIIGVGVGIYVAYTIVRKAYKMFKSSINGKGGSV